MSSRTPQATNPQQSLADVLVPPSTSTCTAVVCVIVYSDCCRTSTYTATNVRVLARRINPHLLRPTPCVVT